MTEGGCTVRLDFHSTFEMLDFVQVVTDHLGRLAGLEGDGFDPSILPDPLAPENVLKSSGRGIFLIRSFMDEVVLRPAPEGGMEVTMVKRSGAGVDCTRQTG